MARSSRSRRPRRSRRARSPRTARASSAPRPTAAGTSGCTRSRPSRCATAMSTAPARTRSARPASSRSSAASSSPAIARRSTATGARRATTPTSPTSSPRTLPPRCTPRRAASTTSGRAASPRSSRSSARCAAPRASATTSCSRSSPRPAWESCSAARSTSAAPTPSSASARRPASTKACASRSSGRAPPPRRRDGGRPREIVATGFGDRDTGGGAFLLGAQGAERIDWLASTGLAVDAGGRRVARMLRDAGEAESSGELLVSDARGIETYRRIDALSDAHDVVWHGDELVVASASTNSLLWLSPAGDVRRTWTAPGTGDAWHLNSLLVDGDRLLACAFGTFTEHRGWNAPGAAEGQGFVFDVESGETVLRGFTSPHHPVRLGDGWGICDSRKQAFVVLDASGREIERVQLGGWTRGGAITEDRLYVGISARRHEAGSGTASVAVLDRRSLREVAERIVLPSREVYAVALVPSALVEGLRRGFRTNAMRADDEDMHALFRAAGVEPARLWAVSDPLPEEACRVQLHADLPAALGEGGTRDVPFTLVNRGGAVLPPAEPYPVHVASRWFSSDGATVVAEGERPRLPHALPPGESAQGTVRVEAPAGAGDRLLRISVVQEQVRWFDDVDAANGVAARVAVQRRSAP